MFGRKKQPTLDRQLAMSARPVRVPPRAVDDDGRELRIQVEFERPRWQQRLGAPAHCVRTFVLDALGREVYESCDRKATVQDIIEQFARQHRLSPAEAEYSVSLYLKTLMSKGLLGMMVDREENPKQTAGTGES
jgi:hypothetical protein